MKKVVFLGSKKIGYLCLHHLISKSAEYGIDVVAVFTNEADNGHEVRMLAAEHSIKIFTSLDSIVQLPLVDYLLSVQYHQILKKEHLQKAKILSINLHMAPLPEYRGCNQFSLALINQDAVFGTTLHVMDESIDGGDILFESRFSIPKECDVNMLVDITTEKSIILFKESFLKIIQGNYQRIPQKNILDGSKTLVHYRDEIRQLKQIDSTWDKEKILRHIRATNMPGYDPPYCIINDQKIKLGKLSTGEFPQIENSEIKNVSFGKNVRIKTPVNLYNCELGDNVFIGPFTEIQSNVKIGANTKIQSHSFICELVNIGNQCFIGHGVVFINDTFSVGKPANNNVELWKKTNIGNHVSIGSNATILPVDICDNTVIGAGSVVTKNILKPGYYVGNPARFLRNL